MKFGYIRSADGVVKSINLDQIRLVEIDADSITIRYGNDNNTNTGNLNGASYFISINNIHSQPSGTISEKFYAWLRDSLAALNAQKILLNDYMAGFEIITAGVSNSLSNHTMTFQPAADSATACGLSGGTAGIIDSKITPAIGNLILEGSSAVSNDLKPIADGSYSLIVSGIKYFITAVSSRISTIEVCPLLLDFVYDPNQQAAGAADLANYFTFAQGSYQMWNYYSGGFDISVNGGNQMMSCSTMNSYLRTVNSGSFTGDKTWPCGHIFNGLLDAAKGLGTLPAFGVVLNNSSVADLNSAQIYVSTDYYQTNDYTQATWVPFNTDFWGSGFAGFGNGTDAPSGSSFPSVQSALLYNMSSSGRIFFPASTSLVNAATSIDPGYANFNSSGIISSSTYCP
jgi:hypothetical protein